MLMKEAQHLSMGERKTGCEQTRKDDQREFVTGSAKPRIVAYRYIIEAKIDVSERAYFITAFRQNRPRLNHARQTRKRQLRVSSNNDTLLSGEPTKAHH
jgi:hypothetical protein